jgi:hypothetical protein
MPTINNRVSLWVGRSDSVLLLRNYIRVLYTRDGDDMPSLFAKDFGISRYDEDYIETEFFEIPTCKLRDLLRGCSCDSVIIPKYIKLYGETLPNDVNVVILLYSFSNYDPVGNILSFDYDENIKEGTNDQVHMRYLGMVTFD